MGNFNLFNYTFRKILKKETFNNFSPKIPFNERQEEILKNIWLIKITTAEKVRLEFIKTWRRLSIGDTFDKSQNEFNKYIFNKPEIKRNLRGYEQAVKMFLLFRILEVFYGIDYILSPQKRVKKLEAMQQIAEAIMYYHWADDYLCFGLKEKQEIITILNKEKQRIKNLTKAGILSAKKRSEAQEAAFKIYQEQELYKYKDEYAKEQLLPIAKKYCRTERTIKAWIKEFNKKSNEQCSLSPKKV